MPSVTYGDVYQWVLMLGGFLIGVPIFISAAGGLAHVHRAACPTTHASWWSGATGTWNPPTIAAWLVTVIMARFGSQEWYQRIRASKSVEASRRGFILGGLMAAPFGVLTMLIGIAALQQMPDLANPEEAFARSMMARDAGRPAGADDERDPRGGRDERREQRQRRHGAVRERRRQALRCPTGPTGSTCACRRCRAPRSAWRPWCSRSMHRTSSNTSASGFMIRTPVAIAVLMGLYWRGANATGAAAAIIVGTLAVLGWQNFGDPRAIDPFWIAAPVTLLRASSVVSLARRAHGKP